MQAAISHIFLTVDDHDTALEYYVGVLGFKKTWDLPLPGGFRWLTVAPQGGEGCHLVLNKAASEEEWALIGRQSAGDRTPLCIIQVDDFDTVYESWQTRGVSFLDSPREMPWGRMARFRDPYGNLFYLMEPNLEFVNGKVGPDEAAPGS
ncbi:Glyoxalase-like domain containing protein [Desulfovibrio sp. X2]|uniref:VOC family protein n=1 Tax=Desulfovibrio sp. X2 TaxID=941449 RepID=UPI0003587065|nr:VOC family protein [Desulfovibrio sp. X2]EPR37031.1 Glyoxalase-like domain containing protein [Desulfovibrio sp. X2]